MTRVVIIPGNGCTSIQQSNWYGWLHQECKSRNIHSICENFPDPYQARREIWVPHIRSLIHKDKYSDKSSQSSENENESESESEEDTNIILVGHSSGAQAVLRYTEAYRVKAAVLVSATYSDLGDLNERSSNYYPKPDGSNPYDFESMRNHCKIFHQFHSDNDPFIPVKEATMIQEGLQLTSNKNFHLLPNRSHFFNHPFPELLQLILRLHANDNGIC